MKTTKKQPKLEMKSQKDNNYKLTQSI
jgi:hypothetical protein